MAQTDREQIRALERFDPEFLDRHIEVRFPGELMAVDTFFVGTLTSVAKVYLHGVLDRCSRHAWGRLYTSKLLLTAVQILNNDVLPFFDEQGIRVRAVLSDSGREYCGRPAQHPYELFLQLEQWPIQAASVSDYRLQLSQPPGITHIHPNVLLPPTIGGASVIPASVEFPEPGPGLHVRQDFTDLLFRKTTPSHGLLPLEESRNSCIKFRGQLRLPWGLRPRSTTGLAVCRPTSIIASRIVGSNPPANLL